MENIDQVSRLGAVIEDVDRKAFHVHCWYLNDQLGSAMTSFVAGRDVVDLGGGDGSLALVMVTALGARSVVVVEKERNIRTHPDALQHSKLSWYFGYIADFNRYYRDKTCQVAVLSFPQNNTPFGISAIPCLSRCSYVIVLGQNDGRNASGSRQLWAYLTAHERCLYIQHLRNDLLVYSNRLRPSDQLLVAHEQHGLTN